MKAYAEHVTRIKTLTQNARISPPVIILMPEGVVVVVVLIILVVEERRAVVVTVVRTGGRDVLRRVDAAWTVPFWRRTDVNPSRTNQRTTLRKKRTAGHHQKSETKSPLHTSTYN